MSAPDPTPRCICRSRGKDLCPVHPVRLSDGVGITFSGPVDTGEFEDNSGTPRRVDGGILCTCDTPDHSPECKVVRFRPPTPTVPPEEVVYALKEFILCITAVECPHQGSRSELREWPRMEYVGDRYWPVCPFCGSDRCGDSHRENCPWVAYQEGDMETVVRWAHECPGKYPEDHGPDCPVMAGREPFVLSKRSEHGEEE